MYSFIFLALVPGILLNANIIKTHAVRRRNQVFWGKNTTALQMYISESTWSKSDRTVLVVNVMR